jgi:hypothetical protein
MRRQKILGETEKITRHKPAYRDASGRGAFCFSAVMRRQPRRQGTVESIGMTGFSSLFSPYTQYAEIYGAEKDRVSRRGGKPCLFIQWTAAAHKTTLAMEQLLVIH